jgi:hypothetical protein
LHIRIYYDVSEIFFGGWAIRPWLPISLGGFGAGAGRAT